MTSIDFLAIGHICKDIAPAGYLLGGAVTYGAVTARRLGRLAGVVTRIGSDIELQPALAGVSLHALPSSATTTFQNIYQGVQRTQYLRAAGDPIVLSDIPAAWRSAFIVLLGPLAQELDAGIIGQFPDSLVGVSPQGWLRSWEQDGRVAQDPRRARGGRVRKGYDRQQYPELRLECDQCSERVRCSVAASPRSPRRRLPGRRPCGPH